MEAKIDCFPCIFSQIATLAKRATKNEDEQYNIIQKLIKIVLNSPRETTPPEFASYFHKIVNELSGDIDPYREVKDKSTELGLMIFNDMKKLLDESENPFETAVKLAIGGNIIDFGVNPNFDLEKAESEILEVFDLPFDTEACKKLKFEMDKAENIFYMLDNCGEAVLDRLLIEMYADKITIGVRGFPILNDVTRRELELSGIKAKKIVDTGDMAPGVSLRNSSPEFLKTMREADFVITKGQGNYETLDSYDRPIFHLLRVKCDVIAQTLNSPLRSLQILYRNF